MTSDFNGHLVGGEGRRAYSLANNEEVGVLVVLRPSAAYSTPAAMDAELMRQMHRAASTHETALGGERAGHYVVSFTADHTDNWYWVSGKEYVIVVAGIDTRSPPCAGPPRIPAFAPSRLGGPQTRRRSRRHRRASVRM